MTATPKPRAGASAFTNGAAPPPQPLGVAVDLALRVLNDLRNLGRDDDRRLEALLRASLVAYRATGGHGGPPDPGVAVQTACAHLAVGEREYAYLALRAAQDLFRGPATEFS